MCVGRDGAAAVLWVGTDWPPSWTPSPHTHTQTHTLPCQTLEIPHIPSTPLTALQPRRDNKGMGRHWIPACSVDSETFSYWSYWTPHLISPIPRRDVTDCPANEMEVNCAPRWATSLAHLLVPLKWNFILLSEQRVGSSLCVGCDSYHGRFQLCHSPLGWGFLFLLGSSCKLRYPRFPGSLSFYFNSGNMPPFLLPCSGHLHYSPRESSSRWQKRDG